MHLAVVTNYAPDGRANGEYGWHLVEGLRQARPDARVTVLAGSPGPSDVWRPWRFNSWGIAGQLVSAVGQLRPDAVLVNTSFNSWGDRLSNLAGFWAIRCLSRHLPTLALVHYLPQTLSIQTTGYRLTPLDWLGIGLACRFLSGAQVVAFTLERDRRYFSRRFGHPGTIQIEHGLLGESAWTEPPAQPVVLAFGYWGPGKNLEMLLRAAGPEPAFKLVVAGGSHPRFPGYLEGLRERYRSPAIEWRGYVPEESVSEVFQQASLVVLPYQGDTGTSGVLHLACQHARALLAADVPVLREEAARLGLQVEFFRGDAELRAGLERLPDRREKLREEGRWNQQAVAHLTPQAVAQVYWRHLESLIPPGRPEFPAP